MSTMYGTLQLAQGAFALREVVGRGGMGEVWRGVHIPTGRPVAAKFLKADTGDRFLREFQSEVEAVARLDHPHIVRVYDHGVVDAVDAAASAGHFREGAPYLVMEFVDGGPVSGHALAHNWEGVRDALLVLLDALAHAHARALVHCDIKPTNVLVEDGPDGAPLLKLTDFGAAVSLGRPRQASDEMYGTIEYMAPEQLRRAVRDMGPWTDLYAVGCLAYRLVVGRRPFHGDTVQDLIHQQLAADPPPLAPRFPVPAGLEAWLRVLMAKNHRARFWDAAAAAQSLRLLGPGTVGSVAAVAFDETEAATTVDPGPDGLTHEQVQTWGIVSHSDEWTTGLDWKTPHAAPLPLSTGRGTFGLRAIPMVGRSAERDALWARLRDVRGLEVALVGGSLGVGKTRLANWLGHRAAELGRARVLRAPARADWDRAALRDALRTVGLDLADASSRTAAELPGLTDDAAAEMAETLSVEALLWSAGERAELLATYMRGLADQRRLLLLIDEPDADALAVLEALRARVPEGARMLAVLCVRDEGLVGDPERETALAELADLAVSLQPLVGAERRKFVAQMLGLSGPAADEVAERTAGNPLYAVQLVADWIERGLLAPGPAGYRMVGEPPAMAETLRGLVESQVESLSHTLGPGLAAVEVAAVLGQSVDHSLWMAACRGAGLEPDVPTLMSLYALRVAEPRPGGWRFSGSLLREVLVERLRAAPHSAQAHRACADALEAVGRRDVQTALLRLETGEPRRAVETLRELASQSVLNLGAAATDRLVRTFERALEAAQIPHTDELWGELYVIRARSLGRAGDLNGCRHWADLAESRAELYGWSMSRVHAWGILGNLAQLEGNHPASIRYTERALTELGADGPAGVRAKLHRNLTYYLQMSGELAAARHHGEEGIRLSRLADDEAGTIDALVAAMSVASKQEDYVLGARYAAEAVELAERGNTPHTAPRALLAAGTLARRTGDLALARTYLQRAEEMEREIGEPSRYSVLNLAVLDLDAGLYEDAAPLIERAREAVRLNGPAYLQSIVHLCAAVCAAGQGHWSAYDTELSAAGATFDAIPFYERSAVELAGMAEQISCHAGFADRATRAREHGAKTAALA